MSINDPFESAKMMAPGNASPSSSQETPDRIDELDTLDKKEVYEIASEMDITGRSKMDKGDLILAIVQAEAAKKLPEPLEEQPPVPDPKPHVDAEAPEADAGAPEVAPEAPEADQTGEEAPEAPPEGDEGDEVAVEVPSTRGDVPKNPIWAVQNKTQIGWGGGVVLKLVPGTQLSWHSHGKGCEVRLRNAGVKLSATNDDAIDVDEEAGL